MHTPHLNYCMSEQQAAEFYSDIAEVISNIGSVLTFVAILSPIPGVDEALMGAITMYSLTSTLISTIGAQLLPKSLTSIAFDVSDSQFTWIDQTGNWSNIRVAVADTEGIDIANLVGTAIDTIPISKNLLDKLSKKVKDVAIETIEEILSEVKSSSN